MTGIKETFDFDDILVVPTIKTHINSRYKDIQLPTKLPLFAAPMDTVVNLDNMKEFLDNGIGVTLPRTVDFSSFSEHQQKNDNTFVDVFVSMGFSDLDFHYKNNFKSLNHGQHLLIDVANGHMQKIMDYAVELKRLRPDIIIMVGNIANPKT